MEHKGNDYTVRENKQIKFDTYFNIQITQYSCDFPNLAPSGCTQYFFGSETNIVQSFNYEGQQHLSNQKQTICVRYKYFTILNIKFDEKVY